jgi:hypothetical protein
VNTIKSDYDSIHEKKRSESEYGEGGREHTVGR